MGKRSTLDDPRIVRPNYCMLIAWSSGQPKGAVENTGKFIAIKAIKMAPPRGAVNTNFIYFSRWWGRQDSNLRRHSQRIYSPPPLPLGTLPQSRRTVLISKDKSGSPAGRSGCVGLMRELPPSSQWMVAMDGVKGAAARETEDEKSRRWERRLFVVRPRVELRVRTHHSKGDDLTHPTQLCGR